MRTFFLVLAACTTCASVASANAIRQTKGDYYDAFRQLSADLPAPNEYRSASGAPGPEYWQQRADYDIEVTLDESERRIAATETVTYTNHSPDTLDYLWVQLDQNRFRDGSTGRLTETARDAGVFPQPADQEGKDTLTYSALANEQAHDDTENGFDIERVADSSGDSIDYEIADTMMRLDLREPLQPGQRARFSIDWSFNVLDQSRVNSRGGYEHFPESDTDIWFLAQWFPRMAAYTDYSGWQHKAFLGDAEFTLEFGDYEIAITVPADHIVSASGVLQNPQSVLTAEQRRRLDGANADAPVFVVTPEEAAANERDPASGTKTWIFKAQNVRDFAWASSRKFIWDAMIHRQNDRQQPEVLAMSFYPNEAEPIWSKYSTHAVAHTLDVYSRFTFPYPYPTAQSVNTWQSGGMEYPMITFNGYRPEPFEPEDDEPIENAPDETWSRNTEYGLVGVVIHEIGHIYFPMTVNSDERLWGWMDEGINSFLEYMAELEWVENFPAYDDHVDVAIDDIREYKVSTRDPDVEYPLNREEYENEVPEPVQQSRNREEGIETYVDRHPQLKGFYDENDRYTVTNKDRNEYAELLDELEPVEREALRRAAEDDDFVYFVDFENIGGRPTPLPLTIVNADGEAESVVLPAEIWRRDPHAVTKVLIRDTPIASIELDPLHQTADADYSNNHFPRRIEKSRIELYKSEDESRDLMSDKLAPLHPAKSDKGKSAPPEPAEDRDN